jgi:hypothetical protein
MKIAELTQEQIDAISAVRAVAIDGGHRVSGISSPAGRVSR